MFEDIFNERCVYEKLDEMLFLKTIIDSSYL